MALEPTIDPSEVGIDPGRLARIDELTHAYVDDGRFPFVQLLVSRRDEIVHHDLNGFADRDSERPIRDDCIVRVYSMTKPVTSVALMMLYEQGKVLLEDPVSKFLPAFLKLAKGKVKVWAIHVYGDQNRLSERLLSVLRYEGEQVLVREGLKAGELLVTLPEPDFRLGEEVTP